MRLGRCSKRGQLLHFCPRTNSSSDTHRIHLPMYGAFVDLLKIGRRHGNAFGHPQNFGFEVSDELCERATGAPLGMDALLAHLRGKFRPLYGLD